ncbi:MAG: 3-phosphoshikimate 1-carboxyvinyltransferase [Acidimicrobiales bacterium]
MPRREPLIIEPLAGPVDALVPLPGSKSITNRALVCAALAEGHSDLRHALRADDTMAMVQGLKALGIELAGEAEPDGGFDDRWQVTGCGGRPPAELALIDARLSGTTSRFLLPVAALSAGTVRVDGGLPLRARPMGPSIDALRALGASVTEAGAPGHLPVDITGGPSTGGAVTVPGDASSQFLSGLLLAAPATRTGVTIRLEGALVSRPYVEMTIAVMAAFGIRVDRPDERTWRVEPQTYRGAELRIEPDASAASYAFAVAAVVGGTVRVDGLGTGSLQGDIAFVDRLERMGVRVERSARGTTVTSSGQLHGIDADMSQISDTAQTLAVVAAFADGPTRVTGIGFIRRKETDRIAAVVTELRRAGIEATEEPDGFVVHPGPIRPATIETYDDHRMAMSFALLGLRAPGIRIADPACVAKTFPRYWSLLDDVRAGRLPPARH